jgi:ketosteroid isomerase-like protein
MVTTNEAAVRRFADAITAGDRAAARAVCHAEIEFESLLGISGHRYCGHAGIEEYFDDADSAWEDWTVMVEDTREAADGRVVIVMTMHARGRGSGVTVESRGAHVWTVRDGKLWRNELFREPEHALQELGLPPV